MQLARQNVQVRQTGRAYQLAIQSALAARDSALACRYMAEAAGAARASRNLAALLARESGPCTSAKAAP